MRQLCPELVPDIGEIEDRTGDDSGYMTVFCLAGTCVVPNIASGIVIVIKYLLLTRTLSDDAVYIMSRGSYHIVSKFFIHIALYQITGLNAIQWSSSE